MDIKHVLGTNPLRPGLPADPAAGRERPRTDPVGRPRRRPGRDRRRGGSRLRFRQRVPPPPAVVAAVPAGRPAGHGRRVAGVHGRRWLPASGSVAVRRLGRPAGQRSAGAPVLGARRRRLAASTPCTARPGGSGPAGRPRQLLRGRRLRPLARRPAADRGRMGVGRRPASPDRPLRPWSCIPRRPGPGRAGCASCTARPGSGPRAATCPIPASSPAPGAVGEYNGKFMVNQQVLRGSAAITPPGHARLTYRNFFPAGARWPMTGIRLARDS